MAEEDRQDRKDGAEDRTDWAEDRTLLAAERTYAGWMRTGMASLAVAIGLEAVFSEFEPKTLPKTVSSVFVALAIFVFWSALLSARKSHERMDSHEIVSQTKRRMTLITSVLSLGSLAIGVILWLL